MPSPGNPSSPSTSSATPAITPTSSGNAEAAVAAAVVAAVAAVAAAVAAAVLAAAVPVAAVPVAAAAAAAGKLAIPFDHLLSFNSLHDGEVSAGQLDSLHMFGIDQGLFVFFSCIDAHPAVVLQAAVPRAAPLLATVAVDLRHRTVPRFPFPTSPKSPSVAAAVPRPAAGHRQAAHRPAAHRPPASFPLSPGFHGPGLGV